ncbi:MAG: EF-P lysine aminoacylase GenX [Planctomycetes bacterium]|nr:EF-P lysine aminoacylase GenX [Planctomycetota bacterium]
MSAPSWRPRASLEAQRARAERLQRVRAFFAARGVLELDPPLLQPGANLDPGVQPFAVQPAGSGGEVRFLPTSPEHALKRAVAAYRCDVWALSPAFRAGERGRWHAEEFRMLEWYRLGWDERRLAAETLELLAELTGWEATRGEWLTWREAWQRAGLDPAAIGDGEGLTRDERLDLLYAERVEPLLGRGRWTVISEFPPERAAQARLRPDRDGRPTAARFEIYREGLELANGYHECTDAAELAARQQRELALHPGCQIDAVFHAMLAEGLPACAGVAVGFDRALALALGRPALAEVLW